MTDGHKKKKKLWPSRLSIALGWRSLIIRDSEPRDLRGSKRIHRVSLELYIRVSCTINRNPLCLHFFFFIFFFFQKDIYKAYQNYFTASLSFHSVAGDFSRGLIGETIRLKPHNTLRCGIYNDFFFRPRSPTSRFRKFLISRKSRRQVLKMKKKKKNKKMLKSD